MKITVEIELPDVEVFDAEAFARDTRDSLVYDYGDGVVVRVSYTSLED